MGGIRKVSRVNIEAPLILGKMAAPHFVCPSSYPAPFSLLERGSPLGTIPANV